MNAGIDPTGPKPTPSSVDGTRCGPFTMRSEPAGPPAAPPVLLLHGIYAGAHSYEWRNLVPLLTPDFRVDAPDLLGAGRSDRPDLEYTRSTIQEVVDALMRNAGPD